MALIPSLSLKTYFLESGVRRCWLDEQQKERTRSPHHPARQWTVRAIHRPRASGYGVR
jgi:hypothetical protein